MKSIASLRLSWVATLLLAGTSFAQEDTDDTTGEPDSMEEIVVYGNKDGDPIDLDAHYEAQLRKRITSHARTLPRPAR